MKAKSIIQSSLALLIGLGIGAYLNSKSSHSAEMKPRQLAQGPCADGAAPQYWVAPMDADYRRDQPGKSPMGMDLVPVCPEAQDDEADVTISSQIEQNLGVRSVAVEERIVHRLVSAVGRVAYDESSLEMVHSRAEGWIEQLGVHTQGASIEAGQELYAIFAPKLVAATDEYRAALGSGRRPMLQAAEERLLALGFTQDQLGQLRRGEDRGKLQRLHAKQDAVVLELGVREGQFVMPGTHIMSLASLERVWILAEVLERDAAWVQTGQTAELSLPALPGRRWQGEIEYIYPQLDPQTRTLKVRLALDNPGAVLRPNMLVQMALNIGADSAMISVPKSALIRSGQGDRVVQALGAGRFRIVPVVTGLSGTDLVQVLQGLQAGMKVVTDGQFLLDSEANIEAETRRLNAATDAGPAVAGEGQQGSADALPGTTP